MTHAQASVPTTEYIRIIDRGLRRLYGMDWRNYASREQIEKHEREGWDAEKFVEFIAMKFSLTPLGAC